MRPAIIVIAICALFVPFLLFVEKCDGVKQTAKEKRSECPKGHTKHLAEKSFQNKQGKKLIADNFAIIVL